MARPLRQVNAERAAVANVALEW